MFNRQKSQEEAGWRYVLPACSALNIPWHSWTISPLGTSGNLATQELGDEFEAGMEHCLLCASDWQPLPGWDIGSRGLEDMGQFVALPGQGSTCPFLTHMYPKISWDISPFQSQSLTNVADDILMIWYPHISDTRVVFCYSIL